MGEAGHYMPRLVLAMHRRYLTGRLPDKKEIGRLMEAEHPQTTRKYLALGEELGLVVLERSQIDKRRELVAPTPKLLGLAEAELAWLGDISRFAVEAMLYENALPENGAPLLGLPVGGAGRTVATNRIWDNPLGPFESQPRALDLPVNRGLREIELQRDLAEFGETLRLCPNNTAAIIGSISSLVELGRGTEAMPLIKQATGLKIASEQFYQCATLACRQAGDSEGGLILANEWVEASANDSALVHRAIINLDAGRLVDAERDIELLSDIERTKPGLPLDDANEWVKNLRARLKRLQTAAK